VPGRRMLVGAAGETMTWQSGTTLMVEVPSGPVRGIGVALLEPSAGSMVELDLRVLDAGGEVLLSGTRRVPAGAVPGDLVVALAGEELESRSAEPLVAELTLRGDHPLVVAGAVEPRTPRLVVVEPAEDGLRLVRAGEASVYERPDALPRIRWAGTAVVETDPATTITMLAAGDAPADVVLTSPGPSNVESSASVDVLEDSGDTIRVGVEAAGPGYVVVSDALSDAFTASVDGAPAELRVADHGGVAVAVGAGEHEVELVYRQPYGGAGTAMSAGAALATIGLLVVRPARDGRRRWFARRTAPT
jgi:hypothetical protein